MSTEFHRRVRSILERAEQLKPEAREPFISTECGDDAQLLREVRSLLPHYETVRDFEPPRPGGSAWKLPGTDAFRAAREQAASADAVDAEATPPFSIDRYTVLEVLGRGGMGIVYRAVDPARERQVAVKLLRRALLSEEHRRRFTLETEILRRLRHPGIGRILDAGVGPIVRTDAIPAESDPLPYFVMEYISGASLTEFAAANHLDVCRRLALLVDVCDAVQYAHHRSIIHRDLKPDNILVERTGRPKVLDFGIAHIVAFQSALLRSDEKGFAGTPEYASPEQLAGALSELTPSSDVYALGLIAHELLTGRSPRGDDDTLHLDLRDVRTGDTTGWALGEDEFRHTLTAIIATALRMTTGPAYACAGELGADVMQLLSQTSPRSRWQSLKARVSELLGSRSRPMSADASRPLSAVLRKRIAMAVESKHYQTTVRNGESNADVIDSASEVEPTPPRNNE